MGKGPLTLLESIAEVPDQQVTKMGKSSIFWLLYFFLLPAFHQGSTIIVEAITIQTQKQHKSLGYLSLSKNSNYSSVILKHLKVNT